MKTVLLSSFIILLATGLYAQNLVPNPGFDSYVTCPNQPTGVAPMTVTNWFQATLTTPDYFHVCNNNGPGNYGGIPRNLLGYQNSISGQGGYVGMYSYDGVGFGPYKSWIEYISCQLTTPLEPEKHYIVSINISLSEGISSVGCNGLGVYFFNDTLPGRFKDSAGVLPFTPQVDFNSYPAIIDTLNWVKLTDTFQADSAYRYIVIGSAHHAQDVDTIRIKSGMNFVYPAAYFYIDDVSVVEYTPPAAIPHVDNQGAIFFPNPLSDKTILRLLNDQQLPYSISITNTMGQTVWQRLNVFEKEITFDKGSISPGLYFYQLAVKGKFIEKGKVVVE